MQTFSGLSNLAPAGILTFIRVNVCATLLLTSLCRSQHTEQYVTSQCTLLVIAHPVALLVRFVVSDG